MPPISRVTDMGSGHSSFIPSPVIQGSNNVFAGNLPVFREGDNLSPHPSSTPNAPHPRTGLKGSSTVFTNNKGTMRIGDSIDCGGFMMTGLETVIVGG